MTFLVFPSEGHSCTWLYARLLSHCRALGPWRPQCSSQSCLKSVCLCVSYILCSGFLPHVTASVHQRFPPRLRSADSLQSQVCEELFFKVCVRACARCRCAFLRLHSSAIVLRLSSGRFPQLADLNRAFSAFWSSKTTRKKACRLLTSPGFTFRIHKKTLLSIVFALERGQFPSRKPSTVLNLLTPVHLSLCSVLGCGSPMPRRCGGPPSSPRITIAETSPCSCCWRMERWGRVFHSFSTSPLLPLIFPLPSVPSSCFQILLITSSWASCSLFALILTPHAHFLSPLFFV